MTVRMRRQRAGTVTTGSGGLPGMKMFRKELNHRVVMPDWRPKALPTTGSIVPWVAYEDEEYDENGFPTGEKKLMPYRDGPEKEGLTPFLVTVPVVTIGAVPNMFQFVPCDLPEGGTWGRAAADELVLSQMINVVMRAFKEHNKNKAFRVRVGNREHNPADWKSFLPGDNTSSFKDVILSKPKLKSVFNWVPLFANDRVCISEENFLYGTGDGDAPRLLVTSASVGNEIMTSLNQMKKDADPYDPDPVKDYVLGDPTSLNGGGKWLSVFNGESASQFAQYFQSGPATAARAADPNAQRARGQGKSSFGQGYSIKWLDKILGPESNDAEGAGTLVEWSHDTFMNRDAVRQNVVKNYRELYDHIYIMPEEEQFECIYDAMTADGDPTKRALLEFMASDFPQFWTDRNVAQDRNRKVARVDGLGDSGPTEEVIKPPFEDSSIDDVPTIDSSPAPVSVDTEDGDTKAELQALLKQKAKKALQKRTPGTTTKTASSDKSPTKRKVKVVKKRAAGNAARRVTKRRSADGMPTE